MRFILVHRWRDEAKLGSESGVVSVISVLCQSKKFTQD
jgi:hypothetical protein